jgi:hypothetical protein
MPNSKNTINTDEPPPKSKLVRLVLLPILPIPFIPDILSKIKNTYNNYITAKNLRQETEFYKRLAETNSRDYEPNEPH